MRETKGIKYYVYDKTDEKIFFTNSKKNLKKAFETQDKKVLNDYFPEKDNQTHRDKNKIENRIKRKYRKLYLRSETVCFIHTVITGQCG